MTSAQGPDGTPPRDADEDTQALAVVPASSARAAGPARMRDDAIDSRLLTSTNIRAARSVRLQIIARVAVTSPLWTPLGIPGASLSASTRDITAGAQASLKNVRRSITTG